MQRKSQHLLHHTSNCHLLNILLLMKILSRCLKFHTLVLLVLWCILWFFLVLICHMLWVWSVDTWLTLLRIITRLFSEFLDIFVAFPKLVWSLVGLERDLLATWIQILLLIWIREGPLQVICLCWWLCSKLAGSFATNCLLNLLLRLNTWLLMKH
jgi:hypothetical protein